MAAAALTDETDYSSYGALIFDCDGTVVDTMPSYLWVNVRAAAEQVCGGTSMLCWVIGCFGGDGFRLLPWTLSLRRGPSQ